MKIEMQNNNDITIVKLQGDLTDEFTKPLQDTAGSIVAAGTTQIVLDRTGVGFIDSKGLEQLLWLRDYCDENNRQLKLAGLGENCTTIMEITRLGANFDSYAELSEAVKSFV